MKIFSISKELLYLKYKSFRFHILVTNIGLPAFLLSNYRRFKVISSKIISVAECLSEVESILEFILSHM